MPNAKLESLGLAERFGGALHIAQDRAVVLKALQCLNKTICTL